jgi:hypothetical protein
MTQGDREMYWCLFSNKAAPILYASSFKMNNGTSGGRIADSQARRFFPRAQSIDFAIFEGPIERE